MKIYLIIIGQFLLMLVLVAFLIKSIMQNKKNIDEMNKKALNQKIITRLTVVTNTIHVLEVRNVQINKELSNIAGITNASINGDDALKLFYSLQSSN